jgi:HD-like signal output (HDOD) protein
MTLITSARNPRRTPNLVEELERLPAEPSAAMRVLWLADDPNSSSDDLARVVAADPALTSKIMRIANSPYYGLTGRVRSCTFAITVLGFSTVRSLAAAAAAGALDDPRGVPEGFWLHAASTATAASLIAPRVGAKHPEAFSLGILHDLGISLLYRSDPEPYTAITADFGDDGEALLEAERGEFGIDHAQAGSRVLGAWRFPEDFVEAVGSHHREPTGASSLLAKALAAGDALAGVAMSGGTVGGEEPPPAWEDLDESDRAALEVARIEPDSLEGLAAQVRRGAQHLADAMRA